MYGITYKPVASAQVWHPEVTAYDVYDKDNKERKAQDRYKVKLVRRKLDSQDSRVRDKFCRDTSRRRAVVRRTISRRQGSAVLWRRGACCLEWPGSRCRCSARRGKRRQHRLRL